MIRCSDADTKATAANGLDGLAYTGTAQDEATGGRVLLQAATKRRLGLPQGRVDGGGWCIDEVWSWRDSRLPLYNALATQFPASVIFRDLDSHQQQFLRALPQVAPPPPPPPPRATPTAIPVAVEELVVGDVVHDLEATTLAKVEPKSLEGGGAAPVMGEALEVTGDKGGGEDGAGGGKGGGGDDQDSDSDTDGSETVVDGASTARPLEDVFREAEAESGAARTEGRGGSFDGDVEEDDIPSPFVDPITFELMVDPVITPSGITYERSTIVEEIRLRGLCPFSQQPLTEADLRPNRALKDLIDLYLKDKDKDKGEGKLEAK